MFTQRFTRLPSKRAWVSRHLKLRIGTGRDNNAMRVYCRASETARTVGVRSNASRSAAAGGGRPKTHTPVGTASWHQIAGHRATAEGDHGARCASDERIGLFRAFRIVARVYLGDATRPVPEVPSVALNTDYVSGSTGSTT
jgi:hypothetical protein